MERAQYIKFFKVFVPIVAGLVYFVTLRGLGVEGASRLIQVMAAYIFPPLGKESIIPIGVSLGVNPVMLVASIVVIDFLSALFVYWNYDLLKSNRRIRRILDRVEAKSQNTIKNRWFGKAWWFGVGLFMIVPFQGSGSVTTTVIGRILGVQWRIFLIIVPGSILSSTGIGFAADTIAGFFLN